MTTEKAERVIVSQAEEIYELRIEVEEAVAEKNLYRKWKEDNEQAAKETITKLEEEVRDCHKMIEFLKSEVGRYERECNEVCEECECCMPDAECEGDKTESDVAE